MTINRAAEAKLLRRMGAGKRVNYQVDLGNAAQEIESLGRSELGAVESHLILALLHDLKAETWPLSRDPPHWRAEVTRTPRGVRAGRRDERNGRLSFLSWFSDLGGWIPDHPVLSWFIVILIGCLVAWLKWDWITTAPNAATASALVAAVALITSGIITSRQLQVTRLSLESSLVYQMLKDTAAAGGDYASGKITEAQLFAVMQSVFIEKQIGSIADSDWAIFQQDFCRVMKQPHLRAWWQAQTDKSIFTPGFVTYIDSIAQPKSSSCKG